MPVISKIPPEPAQRLPLNHAAKDATSEAARNGAVPYSMVGAVPAPNQYYGHLPQHFQPVTQTAGSNIPQTPVPIPHPPQQTPPSHMPMRSMQYQYQPQPQSQPQPQPQPTYMQNYNPGFAQSPVMPMHHQQMPTSRPTGYMQGHAATVPRPPGIGTPGAVQAHANMYNPPRPPEVYTLPDNINETLPETIRREFQHDDAGRVLFFSAAPLDRSCGGLSPESAGLGHSAKYLAGREMWLTEREKKRKDRDEALHGLREKILRIEQRPNESPVVSQATRAIEIFFEQLNQETEQLKGDIGLEA